ncbi:MAG TPA: isochorismatase family protein [Cellvibrio sp.]|nr:isochorismatase family protein [Cellvibrio sp.]
MAIPSIPSYAMPQASSFPANRVQWQVNPARAVLLIHDMQEYFLRFYGENNPLAETLIANIVAIRQWAKHAGVPVVYTAQPSEQSPADRALLNDVWGPGLTAADPKLKQVVAALAPESQDTVLVKWRYSAFQRSSLQQLMQGWQRDQLIIVGVYAHIGCMTTALDAFMRDIKTFLVGDAVADFSEQEHRMALTYIAGRCGAVVSSAQVLASATEDSFSREWLKQQVLQFIAEDEGEVEADGNLMDYGLDSVQVMSLIAKWEKLGLKIQFEELAKEASLNAWWNLIEKKRAA